MLWNCCLIYSPHFQFAELEQSVCEWSSDVYSLTSKDCKFCYDLPYFPSYLLSFLCLKHENILSMHKHVLFWETERNKIYPIFKNVIRNYRVYLLKRGHLFLPAAVAQTAPWDDPSELACTWRWCLNAGQLGSCSLSIPPVLSQTQMLCENSVRILPLCCGHMCEWTDT